MMVGYQLNAAFVHDVVAEVVSHVVEVVLSPEVTLDDDVSMTLFDYMCHMLPIQKQKL